jgi:hypothetical protein
LTRVAVVGPGSAVRARTLVFTLSARARVQITLAGSSRGHRAAGDALRLSVSGRQGTNRYALTTLLRGHHLPRGRYALTVRAGNRAVTVSLAVG